MFLRASSFKFAFNGMRHLFATQRNARFHACAACLALGISIWLELPLLDVSIVIAAICAVFAAETFNTAIEMLCDFVCQEQDQRIGKIKDLGAAGVLVMSAGAAAIGAFLIGIPLLRKLFLL